MYIFIVFLKILYTYTYNMPTIDLTKLTKDEIKTMHKGLNKVLKGEGKKICKTCFEVRELAKDYNYASATKPRADMAPASA